MDKKAGDEQFQQILDSYQQKRSQYLAHRRELDEHIREYHQQAKQEDRALPPLVVPNLKPLKIQVNDACAQLQIVEQQLKDSEEQLLSMIQLLQAEKGKIDPNLYMQKWLGTQSFAIKVQGTALAFNHGVEQKDATISDQLHSATQAAMTNGDYVEARKTFQDVQRTTALQNAEAERVHLHSQLSKGFLMYVDFLSPLSARSENKTNITPDQIEKESQALQEEYQALQDQYSAVERATPVK